MYQVCSQIEHEDFMEMYSSYTVEKVDNSTASFVDFQMFKGLLKLDRTV